MKNFIRTFFLFLILGTTFLSQKFIAISYADRGMNSTEFMFNVNDLSPTETRYENGTTINLKDILSRIGTVLLIAIPMIAVLFVVVGGIMMVTASMGGKDGQFSKGRTIITFNIIALVISLTSYSIMQLVAWVLQIR